MSISGFIDKGLEVIKWPLAAASILILPFSLIELRDSGVIGEIFSNKVTILGGFVGYFLLWVFFFSKRSAGSFFSTFEHELTHALFAWITFKKVTGLQATWNSGGVCYIEGGENWLIYIAPYFFPTLMLIPMILSVIVDRQYYDSIEVMLGAVMAYHMTSTYVETHSGQTDLQETGFLFAALFLPTANVMIYGWGLIYFVRTPELAFGYVFNRWVLASEWVLSFV